MQHDGARAIFLCIKNKWVNEAVIELLLDNKVDVKKWNDTTIDPLISPLGEMKGVLLKHRGRTLSNRIELSLISDSSDCAKEELFLNGMGYKVNDHRKHSTWSAM